MYVAKFSFDTNCFGMYHFTELVIQCGIMPVKNGRDSLRDSRYQVRKNQLR